MVEFGSGSGRNWSADQINKAKRICYRCVWTECDWRNWANPTVPGSEKFLPNDGFPDPYSEDSVGLYQQRARWWGSTEGSMNPFTATWRFLAVLLVDAPNWYTDPDEAASCQRVQRSQYDGVSIDPKTGRPYPFAGNYADPRRHAQTLALEKDTLYFTHLTNPAILPARMPFKTKR